MNTRMVYTIGEALIDIVFINNKPETALPGGSTLNSSVSLGRLSVPVSFISEWGNDNTGKVITDFLKLNNIITENAYIYNDAQTIIAIAFLDENRDASYEFYTSYPEKRLDIKIPEFHQNDIVLMSSFFSISRDIRPKFLEIITEAKKAGAVLIYDPNFRESHLEDLKELKPLIIENISFADIVRGSDEDFRNIFNSGSGKEAYSRVREAGCLNLIYTANKNGVAVHSENISKKYDVPEIKPVSTIGAGDNFNTGLIYALCKNKILKDDINSITDIEWDSIVSYGIKCASDVCMRYENYISEDFAEKLIHSV
jgi:fructokinase